MENIVEMLSHVLKRTQPGGMWVGSGLVSPQGPQILYDGPGLLGSGTSGKDFDVISQRIRTERTQSTSPQKFVVFQIFHEIRLKNATGLRKIRNILCMRLVQ